MTENPFPEMRVVKSNAPGREFQGGTDRGTLLEIRRVLDPDGVLAIVEFKEMEGPPGPLVHIRISPPALKDRLAPFGFVQIKSVEVGPTTYLSIFSN
jgi:hypothetical protein